MIIYHSQLLDGKLFGNSPFKKGGCELITIDQLPNSNFY